MALAKKPFVVLDAELLSSSVWSEAAHVRLVWITLLILCDTDGYVGAALPGIATAAGVSLDQAVEAIERLQLPDTYSRTQTHEGRRITPTERGWQILNFREHLDRLSSERMKARERLRRHRERKAMKRDYPDGNVSVRSGNRDQGIGNREETEVRKEEPPSLPPADRTEKAIRDSTEGLRSELYGLIDAMTRADPQKRDPTQLMRLVTGYEKNGKTVGGVVNAALLTFERLEKSIADAKWHLAEWAKNGPRETRG